jgi:hypothetical protein
MGWSLFRVPQSLTGEPKTTSAMPDILDKESESRTHEPLVKMNGQQLSTPVRAERRRSCSLAGRIYGRHRAGEVRRRQPAFGSTFRAPAEVAASRGREAGLWLWVAVHAWTPSLVCFAPSKTQGQASCLGTRGRCMGLATRVCLRVWRGGGRLAA